MACILVAEDDEAVRRFVVRALMHRGYTVLEAEDGLAALELLHETPAVDLLITDIVMPGLDGIALALRMARDRPDLPILLMTGYSAERERAHNLDELICDVVTKPFTLQVICEAAKKALDGRGRQAV